MKTIKREKQIFWDYDLSKIDLSNSEAKIWYLNRKLMFGDLAGIKISDIKKYLNRLDISPSLRELLSNFLKSNA